jgi:hypothetical protein
MSKSKNVSAATLAEPVRTTAQEILLRRQEAAARREADQKFYAQAVQRLAAGTAIEGDAEACELIATELGHDLAREIDKLKKLARWEAEGFYHSEHPDFQKRHDELFAQRGDLARQVAELQAKLAELTTAADRAEYDRHRFYQFGLQSTAIRNQLAHILEAS